MSAEDPQAIDFRTPWRRYHGGHVGEADAALFTWSCSVEFERLAKNDLRGLRFYFNPVMTYQDAWIA